jgi:wobble nucleotide-excising tRNase
MAQPQNPAEAGMKAMQDAVGEAVASQQRSIGLAQDRAETVIESYRSQAEAYQSLMTAMSSSMEAFRKALESQEETNRALKESLDAYRNVFENAGQAQARNMQLAQSFFDDVVETLRGQIESSRALLLEPAARQQEFFQNVTQEWVDAYIKLLNAPLEFYKASAEGAAGGGGEES